MHLCKDSHQALKRYREALNDPQLLGAVREEADRPGLLLSPWPLAADRIASLSPAFQKL